MSLVEDLGVRVHAAAEGLPLAAVGQAADRLRRASEIFSWVRVAGERSGGVPEIWPAAERLEHAGAALRAARDDMDGYLAAIGLVPPPAVTRQDDGRARENTWQRRVAALTGHSPDDQPAAPPAGGAADSSAELLDRVAGESDRAGLRGVLGAATPLVGLGLATVAPARIRDLARDLFGRPAEPADLPHLVRVCAGRMRDALPGADPALAEIVLSRACHLPRPDRKRATAPSRTPNPVDVAVVGAVVAGALRATDDRGDTDG